MAFTNALLLKVLKVYKTTIYVGQGQIILTNAKKLSNVNIHTCRSIVASGNTVFSKAVAIKNTRLKPCITKININTGISTALSNRTRAKLIGLGLRSFRENPPVPFTKTVLLSFNYNVTTTEANTFPIVGYENVLEILYPIVPIPVLSREVHKVDDQQYKVFTKPSADQMYSVLKFRIKDNFKSGFLSFLGSNLAREVILHTPFIYPFGNSYVRSRVYIITYSKPILEKTQYWRMDVTFLQLAGIS